MKAIGYVLITLGFLAGSLVAVQTSTNEVRWSLYIPAVVVAVVGVALARIGMHREASHEGKVTENVQDLFDSMDRIVDRARALHADRESLNPYDFHERIDAEFREDLAVFVEARESLVHAFGLQAYADVMNEFAAGERYLNRVWSASVDGWIDEVQAYTTRARDQFVETQRKLKAYGEANPIAGPA